MATGDHIRVKRALGAYYHHGIDAGDGTVIHFSGEPVRQARAKVCRCSLEEFLKGGVKEQVHYPDADALLSPEETLALAEKQLGKRGYGLFRNNCEHFATYCKTGASYSVQVRRYLALSGMMVMAGVGVVSAYLGAKVLGRAAGGPRA